jgi:hydrogenase small subunit
VPGAWPIGIGHPCFGCTEQAYAFRVPLHQTIELHAPAPPATYPAVAPEHPGVSAFAVGVGGIVVGAAAGAAVVATRRLADEERGEGKGEKP